MNWATLQNALYAFANGATGLTTVWARQNAPRPAYPFQVLEIIAESQAGQDEIRYSAPSGGLITPTVCGLRGFTMSVQIHTLAPPEGVAQGARDYVATLRTALKKAALVKILRDAGIAISSAQPSHVLAEEVEGRWIARGLLDIQFYTAENSTDSGVEYIEKVQLSGTTDGTPVTTETFGVGV